MSQALAARRALSRLVRFTNQILREQMSCGPVTVQQCSVLEVLDEGARTMGELAAEVGIHQSTLTRIVSKLEKMSLVRRTRPPDNQRTVVVEITDPGRQLFAYLDSECVRVTAGILDLVPAEKRDAVVDAILLLAEQLDPSDARFQEVLSGCCAPVETS